MIGQQPKSIGYTQDNNQQAHSYCTFQYPCWQELLTKTPKMLFNWQQKLTSHQGTSQHWETTDAWKTNTQQTIRWMTITTSLEWFLHLQVTLMAPYGYLKWLQRILLSLLADLPQRRGDRCFSETSALLFITTWNDYNLHQSPLSSHTKSQILNSYITSGMGNPNKQHGNKLASQSDIESTGQEWKMSYQYFNRRGSSGFYLIYVKGLALSTGNASCLLSTNTLLSCEK